MSTHVISIHSRTGGTGKTSVALSTAMQLLRESKDRIVAIIDMNMMGPHLDLSLPFQEDREKRFSTQDLLRCGHPSKGHSPRSFQHAFENTHLQVDANLFAEEDPSLRKTLDDALRRFHVFPIDTSLDRLNELFQHASSGNMRFDVLIYAIEEEFAKEDLWIIVDNQPSLTQASWRVYQQLAEVSQERKDAARNHFGELPEDHDTGFRALFVMSPAWWEMGLIRAELWNAGWRTTSLRPILVTNKVLTTEQTDLLAGSDGSPWEENDPRWDVATTHIRRVRDMDKRMKSVLENHDGVKKGLISFGWRFASLPHDDTIASSVSSRGTAQIDSTQELRMLNFGRFALDALKAQTPFHRAVARMLPALESGR